jgi:hypothetical protein
MKYLIIAILTTLSSFNVCAQSTHIEQSTPFENVLTSMKSDSSSLFMSCFSERIVDGEDDAQVWSSRLDEGKEKFKKRFGDFEVADFSYEFKIEESKLVIYFKKERQFEMKVVQENGVWKLDTK